MMYFLYEIGLLLVSLVELPRMLYMRLFHKKYSHSLARKFGYHFPPINKNGRVLIWIHAISVGETKAVVAMAKLVKAELDNPFILISSTTETGHIEAQRSMPFADAHVYLPFDYGWIIKPIVRKVAPNLVILCESHFWYNFLTAAKAQGAKVALINGKISERSFRRFKNVPWFTKPLFAPFDALCIQSHHYEERFKSLGLSVDKMTVTGNIKFDDPHPKLSQEQVQELKLKFGLKQNDQVLVVGSSHDPEETLVLDAAKELWKRYPSLKVLLVPRHPERFNTVADLLEQRQIPFQRYTQLNGSNAKVILIDTMGLLRKCYQLADVALVGGSYIQKVGGHNIVEPAWYGVPVVFGPYMHSQPELLDLVNDYQCGRQVPAEKLQSTLEELFAHPDQRKTLGEAGQKLVNDMQGATRKTWLVLKSLL